MFNSLPLNDSVDEYRDCRVITLPSCKIMLRGIIDLLLGEHPDISIKLAFQIVLRWCDWMTCTHLNHELTQNNVGGVSTDSTVHQRFYTVLV